MPSICSRSAFLFALPAVAAAFFTGAAWGATFGTVVPIGGHAADIALDEARGVVYVANYTANRIDVVSIKNRAVQNSINVGRQPASLALSPDGRWLLVAHYADYKSGGTSNNALTVLDLSGSSAMKQTFSFGAPPLGVAFGNDGLALVVTMADFVLFDPTTGYAKSIDTIAGASAKALPVAAPTFPREIISASVTTSGDGTCIWGTVQGTGGNTELMFRYDVQSRQIGKFGWIASPPPGPRVMSTNTDGSLFLAAWGLYHENDFLLAQFPEPWGDFTVGTHVIDSARGLIYAQMPKARSKTVPVSSCTTLEGVLICVTKETTVMQPVENEMKILQILDADNLTVREKLQLRENLTGKSILSSKGDWMYAGSDSGVTFLPVGLLNQEHRVAAAQEDVVFRGNWCDRKVLTQEINIVDPGSPVAHTDFQIVSVETGDVLFSGITPARVRIPIDMTRFSNTQGTSELHFALVSSQAVNIPLRTDGANGTPWSFRVLVNNREPDQRGTFFAVPGKLVDVLADPARNRFYVLRQDQNQVLVFDASNYRQIATLRTGNTPWSMAMTFDRQSLIIGADNSQVAHVYNLDTLNFDRLIVFPPGHYPRSIAASANAILAACRVAGPKHKIDRIQMWGIATELSTLGIYENDISVDTVLQASPSGASILAAMSDGRVMLYDANADTFSAARKDYDKLSGAYAALPGDRYLVDTILLNSSLVGVFPFERGSGSSSGFAMADQFGLRTTAKSSSTPGTVQRFDFSNMSYVRPTRMTEAPLLAGAPGGGSTGTVFTRSLAPLANRQAIVSLSTSGFTALPWNYDAAIADPKIESVVSAADGSPALAPGALVSIYGRDLSPITTATSEMPLPTALGDSCLTVNGALVPMIYVSPNQLNGQLPFPVSGTATMVLHTPAGVSNNFRFDVKPAAPSVFRATLAGLDGQVPTVVRASNNELVTPANPVHLDDVITIWATGLGATNPDVDAGTRGPTDPLAVARIQPTVTLGGVPLWIEYAGIAPDGIIYQINARVPFKDVPTGMDVPLVIKQGDQSTTMNVRVVK